MKLPPEATKSPCTRRGILVGAEFDEPRAASVFGGINWQLTSEWIDGSDSMQEANAGERFYQRLAIHDECTS